MPRKDRVVSFDLAMTEIEHEGKRFVLSSPP
jgi:hypothetical protein